MMYVLRVTEGKGTEGRGMVAGVKYDVVWESNKKSVHVSARITANKAKKKEKKSITIIKQIIKRKKKYLQ